MPKKPQIKSASDRDRISEKRQVLRSYPPVNFLFPKTKAFVNGAGLNKLSERALDKMLTAYTEFLDFKSKD